MPSEDYPALPSTPKKEYSAMSPAAVASAGALRRQTTNQVSCNLTLSLMMSQKQRRLTSPYRAASRLNPGVIPKLLSPVPKGEPAAGFSGYISTNCRMIFSLPSGATLSRYCTMSSVVLQLLVMKPIQNTSCFTVRCMQLAPLRTWRRSCPHQGCCRQ